MAEASNLDQLIACATAEIEKLGIPVRFRPARSLNAFEKAHASDRSLARFIEHTRLKKTAPYEPSEIAKICDETKKYGFLGVCVDREHVAQVRESFRGTEHVVVTVVGFPSGNEPTPQKVEETGRAIADGADEIDMVIAVNLLRSGDYRAVFADIQAVVKAAGEIPVKVILENAYLDQQQKAIACLLCERAGADFVKTSTGFAQSPPASGPTGATPEDVALMRRVVGTRLGVKAAGGIRNYAAAKAMIAAGADRLGCSASVEILQEAASAASLTSAD